MFLVCQKLADQEQKQPFLFPVPPPNDRPGTPTTLLRGKQGSPPLPRGRPESLTPLLRDRPGTPTTHPQRFSGQGLILCLGPCPHFGLPGTSGGQGPHHEIRPCPSECGLFTLAPFHGLSNYISSIDLEQITPIMLQVVAGNGLRLQRGAAGGQRCRSKQDRQLRRRRLRGATSPKGSPRRRP